MDDIITTRRINKKNKNKKIDNAPTCTGRSCVPIQDISDSNSFSDGHVHAYRIPSNSQAIES